MIIKTKALVIKEYVIGESDKYITLFSKDFGKIQVMAPKAKKADFGLASGTQLFVYGDFMLASSKSTYRLMNVEIISMFHDIRNDLNVLSYGSYILEFISEVAQEELEQQNLFVLTLLTLKSLNERRLQPKLIRRIFELKALSLSGFMPQLERCAECSEIIEENSKRTYAFSCEAGGIVCEACIADFQNIYKIHYNTLYTMRYITQVSIKQIFSFNVSTAILQELEKVCSLYIDFYIGKRFKTVDFINQIEKME